MINNKKKGLPSFLSVNCSNCGYSKESYTSQTLCNSKDKGMKPMEVNSRAVYAARTVGQGYSGLEKLWNVQLTSTDHPKKKIDIISNVLGESAKEIAESSMLDATNEFCKGVAGLADIAVSIDGTWQKKKEALCQ